MDHMTAKASCFARAYHHKNNAQHIFEDSMAETLLGKDYDAIAQNMSEGVRFFIPGFSGTKEEGLRLIVDNQLSPSVLARSTYCEDKLAEEAWKDQLAESGYYSNQKSFGSLLGISYYLSKQDFEKLLKNINEIMAEKSVVCFDYPSTNESDTTKKNQMLASSAGEQMKALYSYSEIKAVLQKCGFELAEHLSDTEMTARYFLDYNTSNPVHSMQAPRGVAHVTARKI